MSDISRKQFNEFEDSIKNIFEMLNVEKQTIDSLIEIITNNKIKQSKEDISKIISNICDK